MGCPGVQSGFTSYKAVEDWPLPFIADRIGLEALDKKIDALSLGGSIEDVRDLLLTAVGYLHTRYRNSLTNRSGALGAKPDAVHICDPVVKRVVLSPLQTSRGGCIL